MSEAMRAVPTLREALGALFATREYQTATDGPEGGKALLIDRLVDRRKAAARAELIRGSRDLEQALRDRRGARARALGATEEAITQSLGR